MKEEEKDLQEINVANLWNKNLFESIQRLQDFERICRDGAVSITEYLQIPSSRIPEIQFQYLRMMVSELGILIGNARVKLSKDFFLKTKLLLKKMKNIIDLEPQKIFISSLNQQNHSQQNYLSEQFWSMLSEIAQIRERMVVELKEVLFGIAQEKSLGMEKTKGIIRQ